MARQNREISVFSLSAVDLFANIGSVFLILTMIIIPNVTKKEAKESKDLVKVENLEKVLNEKDSLKKKVDESTKELNEVKNELKELKEKLLENSPEEIDKMKDEIKKAKNMKLELERLKKELVAKENEIAKLMKKDDQKQNVFDLEAKERKLMNDNKRLEFQVNNLEEKIRSLEKKLSKSGTSEEFMAIVIRWPTQKHDIDLIVKDPNGKIFNFKNRKYSSYPGNFMLDSRFGPGAEVWQTERLFPGIYTITFEFYNPYGNAEPVTIDGTVFSNKSTIHFPSVILNYPSSRNAHFKLRVSNEKEISIVK